MIPPAISAAFATRDDHGFGPEFFDWRRAAGDWTAPPSIAAALELVATEAAAAALERVSGDEALASGKFWRAAQAVRDVLQTLTGDAPSGFRRHLFRLAAILSLHAGDSSSAQQDLRQADALVSESTSDDGGQQLRDESLWPDVWLIAAIRAEPVHARALDVLADRYWKPLFGRCMLLAANRDRAADLAQETWCKVLRSRQSLRPAGNFPAYLATVATNLWRDSHRSALRAGAMADGRLLSLDQPLLAGSSELESLGGLLPDWSALAAEDQRRLMMDVDQALQRLEPHLRDALVSRYIAGESCADIAKRYGRTEQSVSGWVRQAVREVQENLREPILESANPK